jgi:hypothetical protein
LAIVKHFDVIEGGRPGFPRSDTSDPTKAP